MKRKQIDELALSIAQIFSVDCLLASLRKKRLHTLLHTAPPSPCFYVSNHLIIVNIAKNSVENIVVIM